MDSGAGPARALDGPDYKELYERMQADLDATRERSDETGIEADELRAEVARLQEQAIRDRIAAEYALPPVLAALVQGGEAAVCQPAEQLVAPYPRLVTVSFEFSYRGDFGEGWITPVVSGHGERCRAGRRLPRRPVQRHRPRAGRAMPRS
ncbi:hypothetical protein [Kitasatospora sp. NPDC058046]|uniref:hypothetical protein n=1 Tax=Kitasatospora sp. NPDC058046 TaxID=3346312 RepID=UPI0036DCF346